MAAVARVGWYGMNVLVTKVTRTDRMPGDGAKLVVGVDRCRSSGDALHALTNGATMEPPGGS
jgi:hypothetical protein